MDWVEIRLNELRSGRTTVAELKLRMPAMLVEIAEASLQAIYLYNQEQQ